MQRYCVFRFPCVAQHFVEQNRFGALQKCIFAPNGAKNKGIAFLCQIHFCKEN